MDEQAIFSTSDNDELFEENVHSFIVKLWMGEINEDHNKQEWQGHITHVFSREHRSFIDLEEILLFIKPYIQGDDIDITDK
jgi:hypothetical protein